MSSAERNSERKPTNKHPPLPLLVALLGPTASGKTALALALAEQCKGEIISCDSMAVYRGMELGTAKPSAEQRARVPHHLLDVAAPHQPYSAGEYSRDARRALTAITAREMLPIVSGGTGLYLRALLEGLFPGPHRSDVLRNRLRRSASRQSPGGLHRLLARLDPPLSSRIHPHDEPKLIRALEVAILTRTPLSAAHSSAVARDPLHGYRILRLGLDPPRAALYARINERAAQMFAKGLVEETRGLLAQYKPTLEQPRPRALDALGYRQAVAVVNGEMSEAEAIAGAQQGHRNYAKRQLTWFRREPEVQWLAGFGDDPKMEAAAKALVGEALEQ